MAIAYTPVNIAEASAALAATAFQNAMKTALLGHPSNAYTLVEEYDSASATIHWVVVKCTNGGTASGDFYVCIGRRPSDGGINVFMGEAYDTTTHTLTKYAPQNTSAGNNVAILADMTFGTVANTNASFVLATALTGATFGQPYTIGFVAAATAKTFFCIDQKTIIFGYGTATMAMVGAIDSMVSGVPDVPCLGTINLLGNTMATTGSLTRQLLAAGSVPFFASTPAYFFMAQFVWQISYLPMVLVNYSYVWSGVYGIGDRLQNGRVSASEIYCMYGNSSAVNALAAGGLLRGKYRNLRVATGPPAAAVADTVSVDGRKHVLLAGLGSFGPMADRSILLLADTGVAG